MGWNVVMAQIGDNYNPNLSGLKLPQPLVDAVQLAFREISALGVSGTSIRVIQDSHANRGILYPASGIPIGSMYIETDRGNVSYLNRLVSESNTWVWLDGVLYGTLAGRPSDLGVNDKGFIYSASDALEYRWSGVAWVALDTVRGGFALAHVNKVTKVTAIGVVGESSITDDGSKVTVSSDIDITGSYKIGGAAVIAPTEAANMVLAGPTSGGAALPSFRALVAADFPAINATQVNGAAVPISVNFLGTNGSGQLITSAVPGISGTVALAKLTGGGSNGSLTFMNGMITGYSTPT
jgi:hypothetical protein